MMETKTNQLPKEVEEKLTAGFESAYNRLKALTEKSLNVEFRCTQPKTDEKARMKERLEYELSLIKERNCAGYFLFYYELVQYLQKNKIQFFATGSAASSIVNFLLGITYPNPVAYDFYFESFLNPLRPKIPCDIDLAIEDEKILDVIDFMKNQYGIEMKEGFGDIFDLHSLSVEKVLAHEWLNAPEDPDPLARFFNSVFGEDYAIASLMISKSPFNKDFHKNKKNGKKLTYLNDGYKEVLKETYGIPVFREQAIRLLHDQAGLTFAQADIIVKKMMDCDKEKAERLKKGLCEEVKKHKYSTVAVGRLFDFLLPYAPYLFRKSYAVSLVCGLRPKSIEL